MYGKNEEEHGTASQNGVSFCCERTLTPRQPAIKF